MKTIISFLLLVLFFQITSCEPSSKNIQSETPGISADSLKVAEGLIQNYIDSGELAGFSALVIKDGQEVVRFAKGYSEMENKKAMEKNTIFRIFSMSKPITAVALMTLYDEGKFKLDDNVSKYIPEYAETKVYTPGENGFTLEPQENEMTIRHLLTHTSGLSYGWNPNSYVDSLYTVNNAAGWDDTLENKMLALGELPLNFQPGTKWMYGLSIDVAGYLVEVLSGMPFDKYLQERVFGPLKMVDSGFYVPEEKHERFCGLYNQEKGEPLKLASGMFVDGFKKTPIHFSGGGGLVATIDDYARFCQMLLNEGELDGVRILQAETAKLIMTNQLPETAKYAGDKMGFGLAGAVNLQTGEYNWAGMASTSFWINPTSQMIIITCTQILPSNYSYANEFKKKVESALLDN